jgi:hypothetical protein
MSENHISKAICLEIMILRPQYFHAAIFILDDRVEVLWDVIHLLVVLVEEALPSKKLSSIFITKSGRSSGPQ